jgi:hypothetical protein
VLSLGAVAVTRHRRARPLCAGKVARFALVLARASAADTVRAETRLAFGVRHARGARTRPNATFPAIAECVGRAVVVGGARNRATGATLRATVG